jgi:ABC-2 type transport system ATP-binding protein
MASILECKGLVKRFGNKTALSGIDLALEPGRIVGLLGPNGSGKTTLIKLANGLLTPTAGSILIDGKSPGPQSKRIVSFLPERTYLADWMRVKDLLVFFQDFYPDLDIGKARDMLDRLHLSTSDRIKTLSKGNKEKVQLIVVMSRAAKLYLLDEPIGGVDPAARDYILSTILSNYNKDATVIISTHLIADVERVLDEVVFIREGEILRTAKVDTLREEEGKSVDALFREVFRC